MLIHGGVGVGGYGGNMDMKSVRKAYRTEVKEKERLVELRRQM